MVFFNPNRSNLPWIHIVLNLWWFLTRWSRFGCYLSFDRRFEPFLRNPFGFCAVLLILGFEFFEFTGITSFPLLWFEFGEISFLLFFLFSDLNPAIALAARYLRWRARVWIAGAKIQWWRFTVNFWGSLEIASNLLAFRLCLLLGIGFDGEFEEFVQIDAELVLNWVRVSWLFLRFWWICELWSVTAKREKKNLFVTWRVMNGFWSCDFWHLVPFIACHVDSEPMGMRHLSLICLRGTWTWIWLEDLFAISWNCGTALQNNKKKKILDCSLFFFKRNEKLDCFQKNWD